MAYTRTYYFDFVSNKDLTYRLEFYDQGSGANAFADTEGTLGGRGVQIKWGSDGSDMYAPIKASTCSISFMVTDVTSAAYITQLKSHRDERDVYVALYRENVVGTNDPNWAPMWSGYLLMDLSGDPDDSVPYEIELKAVDGIAALKYYDFVPTSTTQAGNHLYNRNETFIADPLNGGQVATHKTFKQLIVECLKYVGPFTTTIGNPKEPDINMSCCWYNGGMANTTDNPLTMARVKIGASSDSGGNTGTYSTGIEFDTSAVHFYTTKDTNNTTVVYEARNCYDVLKSVLTTWGMRLYYWRNSYYITQMNEYDKNNSGTYASPTNIKTFEYNLVGTATATNTCIDQYWGRYYIPLTNANNTGVNAVNKKITGGKYGMLPALKKVHVNYINLANTNYFTQFPLLPDPLPAATGTYENYWEITSLGDFVFDGATPRLFLNRIYLDIVNNSSLTINMNIEYTMIARPSNTGSNTANTAPWTNGWTLFYDLDASGPSWFSTAGMASTMPTVWEYPNCPPGNTSFPLHENGNSDWMKWVTFPSATFTVGTWEIGFACLSRVAPNTLPNIMTGNGRCEGNGVTSKKYDDNDIYYYNTPNGSAMGSSVFAEIQGGAIGSYGTQTTITQTGDDTESLIISDVLWGDTDSVYALGAIQVKDGSGDWNTTDFVGYWGVDTLAGTASLAELLAEDRMKRQGQNIRKLAVTTVLNADDAVALAHNDGGGSRPIFPCPYTRFFTPTHTASGTLNANWVMHTMDFSVREDAFKWNLYEWDSFTTTNSSQTTNTPGDWSGAIGGSAPSGGTSTPGAKLLNPSHTQEYKIKDLQNKNLRPIAEITEDQFMSAAAGDYDTPYLTVTSLTVKSMPTALLKVGDTIGVYLASGKVIGDSESDADIGTQGMHYEEFEVSRNQVADDTSILVTSKVIYHNIKVGDIVGISSTDLISQYQHKTKGTIAGLTVASDTIDSAAAIGREYFSIRFNAVTNDEDTYYTYYGTDNNKPGTLGYTNSFAPSQITAQQGLKAARYYFPADMLLESASMFISGTSGAVVTLYLYKATPVDSSSSRLDMTQIGVAASPTLAGNATLKYAAFTGLSATTIDKGDILLVHAVATGIASTTFRGQLEIVLIRK